MAYPTLAVRVLIASPSDAEAERDRVEQALGAWNAERSEASRVVLIPVRWETHAVPVLGADAQDVINGQLVDDADAVVAFFGARLGTVTARGLSGTAEEIQRAAAAGKPVHVWFSVQPIPHDADLEQLAALREFRAALRTLGLIGEYADPDDLARRVRQALEHDLPGFTVGGSPDTAPATGARLRTRVWRNGSSASLTVENSGDKPATDLHASISSEDGSAMAIDGPQGVTLLDGSLLRWTTVISMGSGSHGTIRLWWTEDGEPRTLEQVVGF